jgi:hypothetical protein
VAVQERLYRSQADCEISALPYITRRSGNLNPVQFACNNPDDAAALVQQGTSADAYRLVQRFLSKRRKWVGIVSLR